MRRTQLELAGALIALVALTCLSFGFLAERRLRQQRFDELARSLEQRAQLVLAAMRDQDMIGDSQLATAMSTPAVRATAYWTGSEHYFADRIMEELPQLIGEVRQDIVVETTVDLVLQTYAEGSIRRLIDEEGKKHNVSQGALVSIDASGAVRAMVGGYDYATSQFDRASEARRQPGSAFKPFVFMAALEKGLLITDDGKLKIFTPFVDFFAHAIADEGLVDGEINHMGKDVEISTIHSAF